MISRLCNSLLIVTVLVVLARPASVDAAPDDRPNFVFLISEDTSKHHLRLFDPHGTETPNIAALADEGLTYVHAFSNSPVCSVARTTLITGCYPSMIGAHHHRTSPKVRLPESLKFFPTLLRESGYYTTNRRKTDFNVTGGKAAWDESSGKASWRNRIDGQPFFHMQSFPVSHEGRLHFPASDITDRPIEELDQVFVQPRHPDTPLFRYTRARLHQQIKEMDNQIGKVVQQLKQDGLLDTTFIFYFGDHGGVLPGSKGYVNETGLHIPLVVRIPEQYRDACPSVPASIEQFVSFVDFGPTLLHLAGLKTPEYVCGTPFLGKGVDHDGKRDTTFGFADRFDERIGLVRSVRVGKFKYIRNYQPWYFAATQNNYRYKMAAYRQWREMFEAEKLNEAQALFFNVQPYEQLYDVQSDPYETKNLASKTEHLETLERLRSRLKQNQIEFPDLGLLPESYLRNPGNITAMERVGDSNQYARRRVSLYEYGQDLKQSSRLQVIVYSFDFALTADETFTQVMISKGIEAKGDIDSCLLIEQCIAGGITGQKDRIQGVLQHSESCLGKLRAIEYLAYVHGDEPKDEILKLLAATDNPFESGEVLNAIVALRDGKKKFEIPVTEASVHSSVRQDKNVQRRLQYLAK